METVSSTKDILWNWQESLLITKYLNVVCVSFFLYSFTKFIYPIFFKKRWHLDVSLLPGMTHFLAERLVEEE